MVEKSIIAARVPEELKIQLEELCTLEGKTVSDVVRDLISEYIKSKEEEWQRVKLCVRIPKNILSQVDIFIDRGFALDREHVINEALNIWLRVKKAEYRKNWREELLNALNEASELHL